MKKFNLIQEIIIIDKTQLLEAISSEKEFGITIDGHITYKPNKEIVIYKGKASSKHSTITELLGTNYKIAENENQIAIKASLAWQNIIKYNYNLATYDDTTNEGVNEFEDNKLEKLGWHADEFDISYRELIEEMEKKCDGTLLCIEQEEPDYRFSGLGFVSDLTQAYKTLFTYAQEKIKEKLQNDPYFQKETLNEDEQIAARYFKIL